MEAICVAGFVVTHGGPVDVILMTGGAAGVVKSDPGFRRTVLPPG